MRRAIFPAPRDAVFSPMIWTEPVAGLKMPAMHLMSVDFPDPLGPRMHMTSPRLREKDTFSNTFSFP